ncbi:MAG: endonuclease/exonuclease/phosphatase family protein, partial [Bacteroidota bacterium]
MNNKTITKFVHQIIQTAFGLIVIVLMSNCLIDNPIQAQSEKELKVMTFNIRYGTANDGKDSWEFRKNKVVGVIKNFGPDIFGLQEALRFQIDELLKQMPDYAYVGFGRDDGKTAGEHSSIFYSKERFQVDSTQTFWFSETPDVVASKSWGNNITRIATWVRLHDRLSGKTFYVFNVHFDHESQTSRQKSAELLVKKISEKSLPIILTGDF